MNDNKRLYEKLIQRVVEKYNEDDIEKASNYLNWLCDSFEKKWDKSFDKHKELTLFNECIKKVPNEMINEITNYIKQKDFYE